MPKTNPSLKYDLACGQRKQAGFIGVDIVKLSSVDLVYDLTQFPWTFAQNASVDQVYCSHFFEHLTGQERIKFMNELYRILIPKGTALIITPYYTSIRAFQDLTHQWPPVTEASYANFNKQWRRKNLLDHNPIHSDFDFKISYTAPTEMHALEPAAFQHQLTHYWNTVYDLNVTLTKR